MVYLLLLLLADNEVVEYDPDDDPDLHPLSPRLRDLERLPSREMVEEQLVVWKRHKEWITAMKPAWTGQWSCRWKAWETETDDVILAWVSLQQAQSDWRYSGDRYEYLATVRRVVGWSNYYEGKLPMLPTWLHRRVWREDDPTKLER